MRTRCSLCVVTALAILLALAANEARADDRAHLAPAPWNPPPRDAPPGQPKIEPYRGAVAFSEHPAAVAPVRSDPVDGRSYTVITPLFDGHDGNYSYIRFGNASQAISLFYVTVVGAPSGHVYGKVTVTVQPYASPQYSLADILGALGLTPTGYAGGDILWSLYLQSPQAAADGIGFQHVVWNSATGVFENGTICTYKSGANYSLLNRIAINVHTTRIPDYPPYVFMYNYLPQSVDYRGSVFDARNGAYLGAFTFTVSANSFAYFDAVQLQTIIDFHPDPFQTQINILFETTNTAGVYSGITATVVNSLRTGSAYTNMTLACAVNE